ncbi:MAG: hypothetical protein CM1200mP2_49720 [Planctomycetaceae bacterium]|nr:MAG: hypothetical protein CM1200mP2_49720 [Planctomycetaceae bacterium]
MLFGGAGLGGAAIGLGGLAAGQPVTSSGTALGRAKSVIVMFLGGGPPQHETWDPKPQASEAVRGAFGAIATKTPGLFVGELCPDGPVDRQDRRAPSDGHQRQCALVKWLPDDDGRAAHSAECGKRHLEAAQPRPALGSHGEVCRQDLGACHRPSRFPIASPNMGVIPWPGQTGGVLGPQYDPWLLTCDPSQADLKIPDLALPKEISGGVWTSARSAQRGQSPCGARRGLVRRSGLNRQTKQAIGLLTRVESRLGF